MFRERSTSTGFSALSRDLYQHKRFHRALDFGCGVGRLVMPLASRFDEAVGVDISPSMIEIARARAQEVGVGKVSFYTTIDDVPGMFDFAHSYIVFQHIPVSIGLRIIDAIADRLNDGGILAIHLVLVLDRSRLRQVNHEIRKRSLLWHFAINVVAGRKWNEP